jgi:hypothetical protein
MVPVNFAVNVLKNMSNTIEKPNAFAFKAKVSDTQDIQLCICIRENNQWSTESIFYIPEGHPEKDESGGFWIKHQNSYFMKSDTILTEDLVKSGEFFNTVEKGYQSFYEQPEREGQQTTPSE